ncbi:MAG: phosphoribosylformylglycinamidine synthase subunit PurS [Chthoniobacterales bacterium]
MKVKVTVMPKTNVLDPQGVATREAMLHLGLKESGPVRVGKVIEFDVKQADEASLHRICSDLLSNPVIEDYHLEIGK